MSSVESLDRAVDRPMLLGIESLGRDELLHGDDRILLEHQSAEHRLLQFDGLRRHVAGGIGHCSKRFAVARSEVYSLAIRYVDFNFQK